jgi:integrase
VARPVRVLLRLQVDGPCPHAVLHAADEKNRRGSNIPLREDLVADIRGWLDEKLAVARMKAIRHGDMVPEALPADTPVFTVPAGLVRILDRDLALASIPKRDSRGWTVDVHALRHTFGTLLSKGNVAPRTAQAAMRHSSLDLTMNVYTDPQLLDVAGALERLPELGVSST